MRTLLLFFVVFVLTLSAANLKLYLKDGGFQLVREYQVDGDRVKYYSVERSDWEEMPAGLVDLKRTDHEAAARKEVLDKAVQDQADEAAAARENRQEIMKIPRDPGVYQLEDGKLRIFTAAECKIRNSKGRNVLRAVPMPMVSGKATLDTAWRAFLKHREGRASPNSTCNFRTRWKVSA